MQPNGEHLPEQFNGRLNVRHTIFYAPRSEAGHLYPRMDSERQILVPRSKPVRAGCFIEVSGPEDTRLIGQVRPDEGDKSRRGSQFRDSRDGKQTASACASDGAKSLDEAVAFGSGQDAGNKGETVCLNFRLEIQ
jgi:hypothetical protein